MSKPRVLTVGQRLDLLEPSPRAATRRWNMLARSLDALSNNYAEHARTETARVHKIMDARQQHGDAPTPRYVVRGNAVCYSSNSEPAAVFSLSLEGGIREAAARARAYADWLNSK